MELVKMRRYESYRDSGVEWIGEIPSEWEIKKLKHVFFEKKHRKNMVLNSGAISFGKVVEKDDEKITLSTKASYQEVLNGEFLINPLNLNYDLISLRIALSKINVVVSAGYIVLKEKMPINKDYFKFLLHRYDVAFMKLLGSGVRQTISFNHIANSLLAFPPIPEQTAIANFLDQKTAQVDEAIAIKEQQIELLKERKQIIIQKAVTQGLNPNVPMKDSGVEWIGRVPEHWGLKRLKHVSDNFMYGTSVDCNSLSDGIPVLRIPNINELNFDYEDLKFAKLSKEETNRYLLSKGDILIIRTNGNPSLVGKSALFSGNGEFMFASYLIRIKPKKNVHSDFLIRALNSFSIRGALTHGARTSVGNYNLNTQTLGDCHIALPPIKEQSEIAQYLREQQILLEDGIDLQLRQIEKLKEYKTTLINSAVTGKIRV